MIKIEMLKKNLAGKNHNWGVFLAKDAYDNQCEWLIVSDNGYDWQKSYCDVMDDHDAKCYNLRVIYE